MSVTSLLLIAALLSYIDLSISFEIIFLEWDPIISVIWLWSSFLKVFALCLNYLQIRTINLNLNWNIKVSSDFGSHAQFRLQNKRPLVDSSYKALDRCDTRSWVICAGVYPVESEIDVLITNVCSGRCSFHLIWLPLQNYAKIVFTIRFSLFVWFFWVV